MDVDCGEIDRLYLLAAAAIDIKPAIAGLQCGADRWRPVVSWRLSFRARHAGRGGSKHRYPECLQPAARGNSCKRVAKRRKTLCLQGGEFNRYLTAPAMTALLAGDNRGWGRRRRDGPCLRRFGPLRKDRSRFHVPVLPYSGIRHARRNLLRRSVERAGGSGATQCALAARPRPADASPTDTGNARARPGRTVGATGGATSCRPASGCLKPCANLG
jgi:hypothetical protein